jgi:hypothetical protein
MVPKYGPVIMTMEVDDENDESDEEEMEVEAEKVMYNIHM